MSDLVWAVKNGDLDQVVALSKSVCLQDNHTFSALIYFPALDKQLKPHLYAGKIGLYMFSGMRNPNLILFFS